MLVDQNVRNLIVADMADDHPQQSVVSQEQLRRKIRHLLFTGHEPSLAEFRVRLARDYETPWQTAERYGVGYSGDMNPVDHGGFWYSLSDWTKYGFADVVELWQDHPNIMLTTGSVNRPDDMSGPLACVGASLADDLNIHVEIDACRWYQGIEPDAYEPTEQFSIADDEYRLWERIVNMLQTIGEVK